MEAKREIIPGWEVVKVLGAGAFGKVYEVKKAGDDTGEYHSALKVLSIPQSDTEYDDYVNEGLDEASITTIFKDQVKGIVEEFKLMAEFKGNTNIVSYEDHAIIEHEDKRGWDIYIRMELLTPLPELYKTKGMTPEEATKIGIDICRALETCSKRKIIHRDIKPANIFVNHLGDYKLGDFGIARTMEHTTQATKAGTNGYMAPEVFHALPYNQTVDIYSLGLVLYWLLNERRLPFVPLPPKVPTVSETSAALVKRISGASLPPPVNGCEELKRIVLKACAYKPSDRYQTPQNMRKELENVLDTYYAQEAGEETEATVLTGTEQVLDQYAKTGNADIAASEEADERTERVPATVAIPEEDGTVSIFNDGASGGNGSAKAPEEKSGASDNKKDKKKDKKKSGIIWGIIGGIVAIIIILLLLKNCNRPQGLPEGSTTPDSATSVAAPVDSSNPEGSDDTTVPDDTTSPGSSDTTAAAGVPVTGVSLDITAINLTTGSNYVLTATVAPDNASNKKLSWKSSDESIVTVNESGLVTVKDKVGTAIITVITEDGKKAATCTVTTITWQVSVSGVTLSQPSLSVNEKGTSTLTATVNPADATNKNVNWTSSDESVATVDGSGKITAKKAGTATITATTSDGGKTATCIVTVNHAWSASWTNDANYHWHVCSGCSEKGSYAAHTYGSWTVTKAATETSTGTRERSCTVCGYKQTETIEKLTVSSISVKTMPSKTSYYSGETLDTSGLVISVTYNDGSTATRTSGFTCSPTLLNTSGTQAITVTISGKTTQFNVSVAALTVTWDTIPNVTISVNRTASPNGGAATGSLTSGKPIYVGDVLSITYTASTGYTITSKGKTSITVSGNVTKSDIYANVTVNSYTATWSNGTGYTVTVNRTSSPKANANTGNLTSGATVYHGDVLNITYSANIGYSISSYGDTSVTVSGNVNSSRIYANATPNNYTYNVVYKSSNGTSLGSTTVTKQYGTTNTITAPAKTGYTTPSSQSVSWNQTSPKTITFTYTPVPVWTQTIKEGWWWNYSSNRGITYIVKVSCSERTANSVKVTITWENSITDGAWFGYVQKYNMTVGGVSTGTREIASSSAFAESTKNDKHRSKTDTVTITVTGLSATQTTVSYSVAITCAAEHPDDFSGTFTIPAY